MAAIETPCIKVCTLDVGLGQCLGCGRRIDEIERWARMSETERKAIMAELPARLTAMTAVRAATAG